METYIEAKPFVGDPNFEKRRKTALMELQRLIKSNAIDKPIINLVTGFASLLHCFTLQSCYGHFVHEQQLDPKSMDPISKYHGIESIVDYRIAYMAWCIQNNERGRVLFADLKAITAIEPTYIQFGSAEWFWARYVNSYILQVEPERSKDKDQIDVSVNEGLYIEKIREQFFHELEKVLQKHNRLR